jgi:hypothetical protein
MPTDARRARAAQSPRKAFAAALVALLPAHRDADRVLTRSLSRAACSGIIS